VQISCHLYFFLLSHWFINLLIYVDVQFNFTINYFDFLIAMFNFSFEFWDFHIQIISSRYILLICLFVNPLSFLINLEIFSFEQFVEPFIVHVVIAVFLFSYFFRSIIDDIDHAILIFHSKAFKANLDVFLVVL